MTNEQIEALKRECIKYAKRDWAEGKFHYIEMEIVEDVINLLHSQNRLLADGCVGVPREPTEEMKRAGFEASERTVGCSNYHLNGICDHCGHGFDKPDGCGHQAVASYKAMISAAQTEKRGGE